MYTQPTPVEVAGRITDLLHWASVARVTTPEHTPNIHAGARRRWFAAARDLRRWRVPARQLRAVMAGTTDPDGLASAARIDKRNRKIEALEKAIAERRPIDPEESDRILALAEGLIADDWPEAT